MPPVTVQQAFELALQHHQAGRPQEAEALYRQILAVQPNHVEAWHSLGLSLVSLRRFERAVDAFQRALQIRPEYADACSNLGVALAELGRIEEAISAFRRALELQPDSANAHNNLGIALAGLGRHGEAIAAYRRALELDPRQPEAHNNLGNALRDCGQLDEGFAAYRRALQLRPDYPDAQNNLGIVLARKRRFDEALALYRRALQLNPHHADAYNNMGAALAELGQIDDAIAAYRRALQLLPGYAECWNNLGNALKDQGQLSAACDAFRRALHIQPRAPGVHSNLIYTLHFPPDVDEKMIVEEQSRWNGRFGELVKPPVMSWGNDRSPDRRLRIGYVSADFRQHVVGRNVLPLIENHDRESVEIFCYSGTERADELTDEFRECADHWCDTAGVGDAALVETIRRDGVDILVDLAQHMDGNRLPLFAHRPAPVQVSFAGYPASAGMEAIAYRISDRWLEGGMRYAECGSEKEQVFLVDSFWCYDPCGMEVAVNELPAKQNGRITFGSLNNFCKVNESVLKLWARVLGKVKDSRLILLSHAGSHRQRTLEYLEREGIAPQRVEFVTPRARQAYLELYHRLDVVLDTFPYGGHTTSLDALWRGVPVVSLAGERAVSRAGLSQLTNIGLPELVAFSEDDYVTIATHLAHDLPRLAELRATLRQRMEASVLMDAPRFTRQIEDAYRAMWRQWCAEEAGK